MNLREFGARLARARADRRLTVTALARQSGVDYMQICRYEKGQHVPSLDRALRLANVLGISLDLLTGGSEMPELPPPFRNKVLLERMRELDDLPAGRQELALLVLDAVMAGELDGLAGRLRRQGSIPHPARDRDPGTA